MLILKEYNECTYGDAVLAALNDGYQVVCNKTTTWKKLGSPITPKALKVFCLQMLEKERIFQDAGKGIMIILKKGTVNKRNFPCKFIQSNNHRPYKKERAIQIKRKDNDKILATLCGKNATQRKAVPLARKLSLTEKTDLYLEVVWHVKDKKGVLGELAYDPNLRYHPGRYIFIGNELNKFEPLVKYKKR